MTKKEKPTTKKEEVVLYDADPNCKHVIVEEWSGVKCKKCDGWFCY
jgi:hypothetical protein